MLRASPLLSGFLTQHYVSCRPGLTAGSVEQLAVSISLLDRWAGRPVALADLSAEFVGRWVRWLAIGRSAATCNRKLGAVLSVWRAAAVMGVCTTPPLVGRLPEPRRVPIAWTVVEVSRILAAAKTVHGWWGPVRARDGWPALLLLIWDTAVRIGTALVARWPQLDLAERTWLAPAESIKGRRGDRHFVLHQDTCRALARIQCLSGLVFPYPCHRREIWPEYKGILRRAGLPADRSRMFHALRRTSESYAALARGIEWAATAVGHTVRVAERSYISPMICPRPMLVDVLPRPAF